MEKTANRTAASEAAGVIVTRDHHARRLARARALIGVPWKHQGRHQTVGIDCVGLLVLALEVTEDGIPAYGRDPHEGLLKTALEHQLGPPLPTDAQWRPGDVAAMAYGGPIRHCGLLGDLPDGGLSLIHTDSHLGQVTEHPLNAQWRRRVRRVYRGGL